MLDQFDARTITLKSRDARLYLGKGDLALEVVEVPFDARPRVTELRDLFKKRMDRRACPVLVVAPWGDGRVAVCGPTEHHRIEHLELPIEQVEAVCAKALASENRHQAIRTIHRLLPQLEEEVPGLRNGGLFALHELEHGVPQRPDWSAAVERGGTLRARRGRDLIRGLEFTTEELPGPGLVLLARDRKTAVAVLLDQPEEIDATSDRFDGTSPVSYALARADREHLDFVLVLAGSTIRLYPSRPGVGTGRRGRSETFIELNLDLLPAESAGYLWLLFSADALLDEGTFDEILARSEDYAAALGSALRDRVYEDVVPRLAQAAVHALAPDAPTQDELDQAYQVALRILYRLLFVAYAEDRDLLPLHQSEAYRKHSLKEMAQGLAEARRREVDFGDGDFYWTQLTQLWKAVSRGNAEWDVPEYNGTLFSSDPEISELGALIEEITVPDRAFAPALAALLLDETPEGGEGPVDFRPLGVREFGTIYEGLLESELSAAETDLKVDPRSEAYLPAAEGDNVVVRAGEVYLHDRSGARKATGSYYTKSFAVEHLLDRALEPALGEHLARLDEMTDREAGRRFFEFRVADIAMGSGHFLVAAIDRIERRFVSYLAERPLPDVREELGRLRKVAMDNLGDTWAGDPLEDAQLIRRQIARRCVFGVDLNPMAVELARLSIWIHTFVPGLPLSLLDQNLVEGNSLVGIATFEEASELMQAESGTLFDLKAAERLAAVRDPLEELGRLTDANDREIREARELYEEVRRTTQAESDLLAILTASRTNTALQEALAQGQVATKVGGPQDVLHAGLVQTAEEELAGLKVLHFPLAFPHVFLGERKGFDVILGNPPWEQPMVKENNFWAMQFPGFQGVSQREAEALKRRYYEQRPDLVKLLEEEKAAAEKLRDFISSYPGMGSGHPDLYKAFAWRFWHLASPDGGRVGVVLPRSALAAKGSAEFRQAMLDQAEIVDLTLLLNNRSWVFDEVHPQYTIGLAVIVRGQEGEDSRLRLSGPYASLKSFQVGVVKEPATFYGSEVENWNDTASLPLLPSEESVDVFAQLRRNSRLDLDDDTAWRARPIQGDLNATTGKPLMDLESAECPEGFWPVFKGESFDLWTPDSGTYYAWADPEKVVPHLQAKKERARGRSAFSEFDAEWRRDPDTLPCLRARVAFRDITNRTNQRTLITALVPPRVFLANTAPYLLWPRGDEVDQAFLLGVLSSIPLDWYARRFVETHVNFYVLNPFPVPRPERSDSRWNRVVNLAGRLAAPDERFSQWAERVGVECGSVPDDQKLDHIHELDAVVAHLYGLSKAHLVHIFETFHEGWDYEGRLRATLKHYDAWRSRG